MHSGSVVWQDTIRNQVSKIALQKECVSFEVFLCLSCIVQSESGEYVIEYYSSIGIEDAGEESEKSFLLETMKKLNEFCHNRSLSLKSGKVLI